MKNLPLSITNQMEMLYPDQEMYVLLATVSNGISTMQMKIGRRG